MKAIAAHPNPHPLRVVGANAVWLKLKIARRRRIQRRRSTIAIAPHVADPIRQKGRRGNQGAIPVRAVWQAVGDEPGHEGLAGPQLHILEPAFDSRNNSLRPLFRAPVAQDVSYGAESTRMGFPMFQLASSLVALDQDAEAETLYQRALRIGEKPGARRAGFVPFALKAYAALLRKTGRAAQAVQLETRAKALSASP